MTQDKLDRKTTRLLKDHFLPSDYNDNPLWWKNLKAFIAQEIKLSRQEERLKVAENILDMQDKGFSDKGILAGFYDWAKSIINSQPMEKK